MKPETKPFDISLCLDSEEAILAFLEDILQDNDPQLFYAALGEVAKAKGMSEIAKKSGLARESIYHALTTKSNPRFTTIQKVINSLGYRLSIKAC